MATLPENVIETVKKFYEFVRARRIDRAVLRSIPTIGPTIEALIYGGDSDELIEKIAALTEAQRKIALVEFEALMEKPVNVEQHIIAIGSGNGDLAMVHDSSVVMGSKNFVEMIQYIGGSGVNYTMRLLSAGYDVIPILSIGEDHLGELVRAEILIKANRYSMNSDIISYINSDDFFDKNVKTPNSSIIVNGNSRTILAEKLKGGEYYTNSIKLRLQLVDENFNPTAVMIGHIHSDGMWDENGKERDETERGRSTKFVIERYSGRLPIFLNLGSSQIQLGIDFWEDMFQSSSIIQLNVEEAQQLFCERKENSLLEIFQWFQKRAITIVITFGQSGALGSYGDGTEGIIFAGPILKAEAIRDTTGSGDAFFAGMVSCLFGRKEFSFWEFYKSLVEARNWAAFACTTFGAAADCPVKDEIGKFIKSDDVHTDHAVEILSQANASGIIRILESMHKRHSGWPT